MLAHKTTLALLSLFFHVVAFFAFAGSFVSVEISSGQMVDNVVPISKKLSDEELSVLGVVVGKTKLAEIVTNMRSGEIIHNKGDASKSLFSVCYVGKDGTVLSFESSAMGGPDHIVTRATLAATASKAYKNKCSTSDQVRRSSLFGVGLQLGAGKAEIFKNKGKASKESKSLVLYDYEASEKTVDGEASISSILEVHFKGNQAHKIAISKIKSY